MTSLISMAEKFADDDGLVIKLKKYDEINYLDVSKISAYPQEKKQLFVGGYKPLRYTHILYIFLYLS